MYTEPNDLHLVTLYDFLVLLYASPFTRVRITRFFDMTDVSKLLVPMTYVSGYVVRLVPSLGTPDGIVHESSCQRRHHPSVRPPQVFCTFASLSVLSGATLKAFIKKARIVFRRCLRFSFSPVIGVCKRAFLGSSQRFTDKLRIR